MQNEEFLVIWQHNVVDLRSPRAVLSWHGLPDLDDCLHLVQHYVETHLASKAAETTTAAQNDQIEPTASRKRKLSGDHSSRDGGNGLLTPANSAESPKSRSPSTDRTDGSFGPKVYNGFLEKKEGRIVAKPKKILRSFRDRVVTINATTLPTPAMKYEASKTSLEQAEYAIRMKFLEMLLRVPNVLLENLVDRTTPSLNFTFIIGYKLGEGIAPRDPDAAAGCAKKCKPNMGQNIGCEYTQQCECLEYAAVDVKALEKKPEKFAEYQKAIEEGTAIPMGMPKRFPYKAPNKDNPSIPQTLNRYYLEKREPIYECNQNCNCGPRCKSRVVQKGRKVSLTIFKTKDRGWGVKCNEDLVAGEFIDVYLGEVITNAEADRREEETGAHKESYLFILDKFVGENNIEKKDCYIIDGQHMGGPTRFINHSCEPNCVQYAVSYNKDDRFLYDMAFFANENILAGTELTFDYMDEDEQEEEDAIANRIKAQGDPANKDKIPCNCGAVKCRGFLW